MEWTAQTSQTEDEASRVRRASRASASPASLQELAGDSAATVRAAVALNTVFAMTADSLLVQDPDSRVRSLLAAKMAHLLPGLSESAQSAAQSHVHAMLRVLAEDATVRVRAALATALCSMQEAPRDVIMRLARDTAVTVSSPVVRYSPLLTDADLLDLLATPSNAGIAVSVANRAGLSGAVAERIAEHADTEVVTALLSNPSATIQEATLDSLIGRAGDHPEWHEPLVCRPVLPARCIRALSRIVARSLLTMLLDRPGVPPDVAAELRAKVDRNLDLARLPSDPELLRQVGRLHAAGQLDETALMDAAWAGDGRRACMMLALTAGLSLPSVDRAMSLRSAKVLVSLVHRAGFSMQAALVVQSALGHFGPGEMLAAGADGGFPLSSDEMAWQVELLDGPD